MKKTLVILILIVLMAQVAFANSITVERFTKIYSAPEGNGKMIGIIVKDTEVHEDMIVNLTESGWIKVDFPEDGETFHVDGWININDSITDSGNNPPVSGESGFRQTKWGMTVQQVKEIENKNVLYERDNVLIYKDAVLGYPCQVVYIFADNKLTRSKYIFTQEHSNKNRFIYEYEDLKETLTQKYGNPIEDEHFWTNDLYKDEKEDWGLALSIGDHSYYCGWETENTEIYLILSGDNYEVDLMIEYYSKEYKQLEKESQVEKAMENL